MPPCGRYSSVVRRRREDTCVCRKAKARDPRTQKCPAAVRGRRRAAACRAGGPRVSETCDRSRRESITRFTPPVHFANGRRSVTVKVTVHGVPGSACAGSAVAHGVAGPIMDGPGSCRNVAYLQRKMRPARARRHLRGRYRGVTCISYPDISYSARPRADETARTRVSAVSRRSVMRKFMIIIRTY